MDNPIVHTAEVVVLPLIPLRSCCSIPVTLPYQTTTAEAWSSSESPDGVVYDIGGGRVAAEAKSHGIDQSTNDSTLFTSMLPVV